MNSGRYLFPLFLAFQKDLSSGSSKTVVLKVPASPGNMLKTHFIRTHPHLLNLRLWAWTEQSVLSQPSRRFWYTLKFKNHCSRVCLIHQSRWPVPLSPYGFPNGNQPPIYCPFISKLQLKTHTGVILGNSSIGTLVGQDHNRWASPWYKLEHI